MPTLTWTGDGVFSDAGRGFTARPDTTHEFDDQERAEQYLDHASDNWVKANATSEDENGNEDETSPPFDPADYTVEELEDEMGGGEFSDAEREALADAERDGEDRSSAIETLEP